jgi:hypothetical protein
MRKLLRTTTFLCCVGGTVVLGFLWRGTAQLWQGVKPGTTITQLPKKPSDIELERKVAEMPIVDFTEFDPVGSTDPARAAKSTKYNRGVSMEGIPAPKLDENMESVMELPMTHRRAEPAFPVTSDVIVIGTVREAKAYLSTDRTDIYSDVSLSIEEILKAAPQYGLRINGTVSADRRGGGVRFPSGKIVRGGYWARAIPASGRRYLLFLKDTGDAGFSIVTGYELTGKGVIPLDGIERSGFSVFENYDKLRNSSEASLLEAARKAISENGSGGGGAQ